MNKQLNTFIAVAVLLCSCMAYGNEAVKLYALNSMERIFQHQPPFGKTEVRIAAAGNEVESFQIVVAAIDRKLDVRSIVVSELKAADGTTIGRENIHRYREEYTRVRRSTPRSTLPPGLYPDILVPFLDPVTGKSIKPRAQHRERWGEPLVTVGHDMYALPFEVHAGQNQPIWVDVHVPANTPAGEYRGVVTVKTMQGQAEMPVVLEVWGFSLPDGPSHGNRFASGLKGLAKIYDVKVGSEEFDAIELCYCKAMAEHRLTPPIPDRLRPRVERDGSLTIDPERHQQLQAFMQEYKVLEFPVPLRFVNLPSSTTGDNYKTVTPENKAKALRYYREYYQYLEENGWAERALVYVHDEPNTRENYEQVLVKGAIIKEAAPKLKRMITEQTYPQAPDFPELDEAVDIWCPMFARINRASINEKLAKGQVVWSYTALAQGPKPSYRDYETIKDQHPPYWHIDQPLLSYRVPLWMNRQYNITGILYWGGLIYQRQNPWYNAALIRAQHFNGSGFMIYPGTPCGIQGPIASLRLKNLRDGMEDYEYMVLLEQKAGSEAVIKIVNQVVPEWWEYSRDPETILKARQALAEAITAR